MAEEQATLFPAPGEVGGGVEPTEETAEEAQGAEEAQEVDPNADILARLERAERRNEELTNTLLREKSQSATTEDEFVDMDVPSPIDDPDGFASAIQHNAEMKVKRGLAEQASKTSESESLAEAWNDFGARHKDLADKPDLVSVAATLVNNELSAQGLDPKKYIGSQRDAYFDKILSKVDAVRQDLGAPGSAPSRTGGTLGSVGGKSRQPVKKGEEKPPSFMDQLKNIQEKTGHF